MRKTVSYRKVIGCLITIIFLFNIVYTPITVYAETTEGNSDTTESDRDALRNKLENQEDTLRNEMEPINPFDSETTKDVYNNAVDAIENQEVSDNPTLNVADKARTIQKGIFELVIKTRTGAIITYALTWILGIIYVAVMGSRDVNKRRKVFLLIRNSTVIFFVYINIPLFIIWLNTDKSQLTQVTTFNLLYDLIDFLKRYSIIISCLLAYAGATRLIISKKNLPVRKQGQYLIKFAIIALIFLNLVPVAIYFII